MENLRKLLQEKPEYISALESAIEYEEEHKDEEDGFTEDTEYDVSWTYSDIHADPSQLYRLETAGVLERVFNSNSTTRYVITDRGRAKDVISEAQTIEEQGFKEVMHDFPDEDKLDGIFDDVIGYDDIKWLLKRGLTIDSITNFLLVGPPGSAKTVFLLSISSLEDAEFVPSTEASSAGFIDTLFEDRPKYMLLDELDDMEMKDQKSLSSYTDTGIVKETKYGKKRKMKTNTKTLATANDTDPILDHILDRFTVLHFEPYTREEFIEVCEHILPRKEGKSKQESKMIAESLYDRYGKGDVRQAIQVARLSRGDPEKVIGVLEDYSPEATGVERVTQL